jgi:hypothetical protein
VTNLEHYLNTASRGLWGKRKLEVREELEAHVLERARKHELSGLTREDAISKTLEELGNARAINHKMTEVHTMPKLFRSFIATAFAFFALLASGTKPVIADRLAPTLEVICTKPSGARWGFLLRPNTNWTTPTNTALTRAFGPVVLNWSQEGPFVRKLERHIGAQMVGSFVLMKTNAQTRAKPLECHAQKLGTDKNLRDWRDQNAQVMRQLEEQFRRSNKPR